MRRPFDFGARIARLGGNEASLLSPRIDLDQACDRPSRRQRSPFRMIRDISSPASNGQDIITMALDAFRQPRSGERVRARLLPDRTEILRHWRTSPSARWRSV